MYNYNIKLPKTRVCFIEKFPRTLNKKIKIESFINYLLPYLNKEKSENKQTLEKDNSNDSIESFNKAQTTSHLHSKRKKISKNSFLGSDKREKRENTNSSLNIK